MILTVTLNPSVDKTIFVEQLHLHDTNRVLRVGVDAGGKVCNGPTHRLQPASPHATSPTPSRPITPPASNPHMPNP